MDSFPGMRHTTLFQKISCPEVVRVGGGWGGGEVFRESTGIREEFGDFSGIRLSGAGNLRLFWNKKRGICSNLEAIWKLPEGGITL